MWVDSEAGQGSAFHFTANVGIPPARRREARIPDRRPCGDWLFWWWTIMPRAAAYYTDARAGDEARSGRSGREALDILRQHARSGDRFALFLLDGHMPGMDGFTLARRIDEEPALAGPRVMMLRALDIGSIGPELRGTGHYVVKPVTPADLLSAILRALGEDGRKRRHRVAGLSGGRAAADILLVEDNAVNQQGGGAPSGKAGHSVKSPRRRGSPGRVYRDGST